MSGPWVHNVVDASGDWHVVAAMAAVLTLEWILVGVIIVAMFPPSRAGHDRRAALRRGATLPVSMRRRRCDAATGDVQRCAAGQERSR